MKKSRVISLIIVAVSFAAVAFAVLGLARGGPGGPGGPGQGPGRPTEAQAPASDQPAASDGAAARRYAVRVTSVERGNIESLTKLNGEVIPEQSVQVLPEVAGTVAQISVDVGDRVVAGSVVAQVDPSRPGTRFQASPSTAPISGTVTAVYVDPGATVNQSTPLLQIGTLDSLEIVVDIPERFVGAVTPATTASVVFSAFPSQPRSARVSRISPVLDPGARSKEVAFVLDPRWDAIQSGMFAEVTIVTDRRGNALTVPVESIVTRASEESVFVVEDDVARLLPVETGLTAGGRTEILAGLAPGDRVVIEGQNLLEDGSEVRVVNTAGEATS